MKKYITYILVGLAILFVLDFLIGSTLKHFYFSTTSGMFQKTTYAMEETEAEMLIFGASRANHHYDVKLIEESTDMSVHNVGRDAESIFYQTAILKSIIERYTPKKIILDFPGTFENVPYDYDRIFSLLPYYDSHPEIRDIVELKSKFEKLKLFSKIYPYNSTLVTIGIGNLEINKERKYNESVYKGYVPLTGVFNQPIDSLPIAESYEIDKNKMDLFKSFIQIAKENDIELVVIYSPVYYLYNRDYTIELCESICKENGINFFDFSKDEDFLSKPEFFQDKTHLNSDGATLFTKKILQKI